MDFLSTFMIPYPLECLAPTHSWHPDGWHSTLDHKRISTDTISHLSVGYRGATGAVTVRL